MGKKRRKKKFNKLKHIKSISRMFANVINTTTKHHGDKKKAQNKNVCRKRIST